jgi:hypothetical protein
MFCLLFLTMRVDKTRQDFGKTICLHFRLHLYASASTAITASASTSIWAIRVRVYGNEKTDGKEKEARAEKAGKGRMP